MVGISFCHQRNGQVSICIWPLFRTGSCPLSYQNLVVSECHCLVVFPRFCQSISRHERNEGYTYYSGHLSTMPVTIRLSALALQPSHQDWSVQAPAQTVQILKPVPNTRFYPRPLVAASGRHSYRNASAEKLLSC